MLSSRGDFVAWSACLFMGLVLGTHRSAVAQSSSMWKKPEGDPPAWLTADADRWSRLNDTRKVLAKKVTYDFEGVPLREVMVELGRQVGVPIHINEVELDNAGQSSDQPVTAHGKNIRLSEVKEQILRPLDLSWRIRESDIELSSNDDISGEPVLMIYDLAYKTQESADLEYLSELISQTIDCDEWRDYGGTGDSTLLAFGSALIVVAPDGTQGKIAEFLAQLNKLPVGSALNNLRPQRVAALGIGMPINDTAAIARIIRNEEPLRAGKITLPPGREYTLVKLVESKSNTPPMSADKSSTNAPGKWTQPQTSPPAWLSADLSADRQELLKKLREPVSVEINQEPLNQAMVKLLKGPGIAFWIDAVELDNAGQSFDVPVSISLQQASLSEVLDRMLKPLDLTYRIDGQRLEITSNDDAESEPSTRVYDMAYMSEKPFDVSLLANVIAATVDPDAWRDYGGTGDSAIICSGSQLFISAADTTFMKIDSLMNQLSKLHPDNLPTAKATESTNYTEVQVQNIPAGATIEIPSEGMYLLRLARP